MDAAGGRWQRPVAYPDRGLERLLRILGGSRRRTLRGSRSAWHQEEAMEPVTPAGSPNSPSARVRRALRGPGQGRQEPEKKRAVGVVCSRAAPPPPRCPF